MADRLTTAAEHAVFLMKIVTYVNVVSLTILVADYIHTLQLEVELIWNAKWGQVKILFLLARYSPFFDVPLVLYYQMTRLSNQQCLVFCYIVSCSMGFGIEISEAILIVRTYALSGNSRKVLICLLIQFVVASTLVIIFDVIYLRSLQPIESPFPSLTGIGCYFSLESSNILFANFVLVMLVESAIMVLTICIGVKRYRHSRNPLIVTLYRDGIFYFVCLFLISAANVVVMVAGPVELLGLVAVFQRVMHSIISTRIVLQVRNTARGRDTIASISDLQFGSRPGRQIGQSSTDQSTAFPPTNEDNNGPE